MIRTFTASLWAMLLMIMMVLFCASVPAYADIGSTVNSEASKADQKNDDAVGLVKEMTNFSNKFKEHASKWGTNLRAVALWLFFTLGGISIVWTFVDMVLRQGNIGDIFGEIAKFCVVFGLFLFFVEYGDKLAVIIFRSFENAVKIAEGLNASPIHQLSMYVIEVPEAIFSAIMDLGGNIGFNAASLKLLLAILILFVLAIFLLFILALCVIEIVMTQLTLWVLMYAGVFVLGFGGCKWGRSMAIQYFKQVMSVAASYMCVLLITLAACSFINDALSGVQTDIRNSANNGALLGVTKLMQTCIMVLLCYLLIKKVPTLFGSMFGAVGYSGSEGTGRALSNAVSIGKGAALGAAAVSGKAVSGTGKLVGGGLNLASSGAGKAIGIMSNMKMAWKDSKARQATGKMNQQLGRSSSGSGAGKGGSSGSQSGSGKGSSGSSDSGKPPASSEKYYGDKGGSFLRPLREMKANYNSGNSSTRSAANEDKVRHNAQEYAETKAAYEKAGGNPESVKVSNIRAGLSALGEGLWSGARAVVSPITRHFKK